MFKSLRQIIPESVCLKCDICCRYPEEATAYVPCFLNTEISHLASAADIIAESPDTKPAPILFQDHYVCLFFIPEQKSCKIYAQRPFDCQLYPFMVAYTRDYKSVALVLDSHCRYLADRNQTPQFQEYIDYLTRILEGQELLEQINANKNFINEFQDDFIYLRRLDSLSKKVGLGECGLTRLALEHRPMFEGLFKQIFTDISSFSFSALFIWLSVLNILWKQINSCLYIFAGNDRDYFLLLPPLGTKFDQATTQEALAILAVLNAGDNAAARIDNIGQESLDDFISLGLKPQPAAPEYIYNQNELAELKGNRYKSKRAGVNYFIKNYRYCCRDFESADVFNCLRLYRQWAQQRLSGKADQYYRALIQDSYLAQKKALMNFGSLGLRGLVVEVEGEIKGYTLGYPLNQEIFVILFETASLQIKGLAQFIFQEFSRRLSDYKYINTLSDSGLDNLKQARQSYHPLRKTPVFTAYT